MTDQILRLLVVVGTALLAARLYTSGLQRRYRVFFYYLIFATLQSGLLYFINPRSGLYQRIWIITEPISWIFFVLLLLELYSLVLEAHQGIKTIGRWALYVALFLALLASLVSVVPRSGPVFQSRLQTYFYVAERAINFSLVVFLVTILFFIMWYPLTLSRNVVVHTVVYSIYFLTDTMLYLVLARLGFEVVHTVGEIISVLTLGSLLAWLLLLSPAGEERKISVRPPWMPGQEEAMVGQLNDLNRALLRAARK
jgi:hypothetical protein